MIGVALAFLKKIPQTYILIAAAIAVSFFLGLALGNGWATRTAIDKIQKQASVDLSVEKQRTRDIAKTLTDLSENTISISRAAETSISDARIKSANLIAKVSNEPDSMVCFGSPVMQSYLNGLRR